MIDKNFFGSKGLATSGTFGNVLACRAKPSDLFKHQLIQYLCGFHDTNFFWTASFFSLLDTAFFFPFSDLLIYSFKKTCFIPTACALGISY